MGLKLGVILAISGAFAAIILAFGYIDRESGAPDAHAAVQAPAPGGPGPAGGAEPKPDLIVLSIEDRQGGTPCTAPAGLAIVLYNQSSMFAGASMLLVQAAGTGGTQTVGVPVVFANSFVTVFSSVTGLPSSDTYTATADSTSIIDELDETNNTLSVTMPMGTLPTCTPTATPTPANPTVTPTPTSGLCVGPDTDEDEDGLLICFDNCPTVFNPSQVNTDGDQLGNACDFDDDGDGVQDSSDNCALVENPDQLNTDGNFIDNSPPYAQSVDDRTRPMSDAPGDVCDDDDDNDGLTDTTEVAFPCPTPTPGPGTPTPCPPHSCNPGSGTSPFDDDSDGDGILDGIECAWGYDPTNPGYRPSAGQCASAAGGTLATDTDGDKIRDYLELCSYATDRTVTESDNDVGTNGARDGCEVASLNADRIVNSLDQGMLAQGIIHFVPYTSNVDFNKDGVLNSIDQGLQAQFILPPGQCP